MKFLQMQDACTRIHITAPSFGICHTMLWHVWLAEASHLLSLKIKLALGSCGDKLQEALRVWSHPVLMLVTTDLENWNMCTW